MRILPLGFEFGGAAFFARAERNFGTRSISPALALAALTVIFPGVPGPARKSEYRRLILARLTRFSLRRNVVGVELRR